MQEWPASRRISVTLPSIRQPTPTTASLQLGSATLWILRRFGETRVSYRASLRLSLVRGTVKGGSNFKIRKILLEVRKPNLRASGRKKMTALQAKASHQLRNTVMKLPHLRKQKPTHRRARIFQSQISQPKRPRYRKRSVFDVQNRDYCRAD